MGSPIIVFNGGEISEVDLKAAYNRLVQLEDLSNPSHTEKDFKSTAQLATKSFLRRDQKKTSEISYSLFNPSISDFLLGDYGGELEKLIRIYKSLCTLKSLKTLTSLSKQGVILGAHVNKIKEGLIEEVIEADHGHDYLIYLSSLFPRESENNGRILQFIKHVVTNLAPITELGKLLKFLRIFERDLTMTDHSFLLIAISHRYLEPSEICELSEFLVEYEIKDENLIGVIQESVDVFARAELDSRKDEINLDNFVSCDQSPDGEVSLSVDEASIQNEIYSLTESIIDENYFEALSNLNLQIDIGDIAEDVNVDELVESQFNNWEPDDDYFRGGDSRQIDDIDDLFERT